VAGVLAAEGRRARAAARCRGVIDERRAASRRGVEALRAAGGVGGLLDRDTCIGVDDRLRQVLVEARCNRGTPGSASRACRSRPPLVRRCRGRARCRSASGAGAPSVRLAALASTCVAAGSPHVVRLAWGVCRCSAREVAGIVDRHRAADRRGACEPAGEAGVGQQDTLALGETQPAARPRTRRSARSCRDGRDLLTTSQGGLAFIMAGSDLPARPPRRHRPRCA